MSSRKHGRKMPTELTDKERIFLAIIQGLDATQTLAPRAAGQWSSEPYKQRCGGDGYHVHFAPWQKPVAGDLVFAKTGFASPYKVAFYMSPLPGGGFGGAVVREIGTGRLCNYSNEEFTPIVGLTKSEMLEGDRYKFYVKVQKAFAKVRYEEGYVHRFGGVDFPDDQANMTATIWVRERFGGRLRLSRDQESLPYSIPITWTPRMSVKAILAAMRAGGYGVREFAVKGGEVGATEAQTTS